MLVFRAWPRARWNSNSGWSVVYRLVTEVAKRSPRSLAKQGNLLSELPGSLKIQRYVAALLFLDLLWSVFRR